MAGTWRALVKYPDGSSNVRLVFASPLEGALLVVAEGDRWMVRESTASRPGEFEGQEYQFVVWVDPAPEE